MLTVGALMCSGCGFFAKEKTVQPALPRDRVIMVVQPERLAQGGKLLITPFVAGVGVTASDDLDRVALRIVKGMIDGLMENQVPFEILVAQNAATAELNLEGRITQKKQPSRLRRWIGGRKVLIVEGQMTDVRTGRPVLRFSHQLKAAPGESFEDLGIRLGHELGQRIARQMTTKM